MAGAYRTEQDLVLEALAVIGVLSPGQAVDPEDYNYVQEKLDSIMRLLSALFIVNIPDTQAIPGVYFAPLADIVAGECALKFSLAPDDYVTIKNAGLGGAAGTEVGSGVAAKSLKQINRLQPTYQTVPSEFF